MKIAILYGKFEGYEDYPGQNLAKSAEADALAAGKTRKTKKRKPKKTDIEAIADALRALGHDPLLVAIDGRPPTLARLARLEADLFFNLVESYNGDDTME